MGQDEQMNVNAADNENSISPADQEREQQIDRLDSFFSGLQPGVSLLIERLRPSWCSGLLEEISVPEDGIDLDYLIETWGGHLLSVKMRGKGGRLVGGSYKVPLFTYPPLRYGKQIRQYDKGERFEDERPQASMPAMPPINVNPSQSMEKIVAAIPMIIPIVTKLMDGAESRRQNDMAMMIQLMKGNQGSALGDITKIGAMMTQLNEMFKQNAGGGDAGGGEVDFISNAMDIVKMVLDNKPAPAPQPPQLRQPANISAPSPVRPSSPPPRQTIAPEPAAASVTQLNPQKEPLNIADAISQMNPDEAATTVLDALSKMSPDKQQAAVVSLLGEYESLMGGDDQDFEGDDYEEQDQRGVK